MVAGFGGVKAVVRGAVVRLARVAVYTVVIQEGRGFVEFGLQALAGGGDKPEVVRVGEGMQGLVVEQDVGRRVV